MLEWTTFIAIVLFLLALDLGVFHRRDRKFTFKESVGWSLFWIALALVFNGWIYIEHGHEAGMEFFTAYILEKSLSVDNLFVFLMVFSYFKVAPENQHRVLFWGILGALVMRAFFIIAGIELLARLHWLIYLFGFFLIWAGIKMIRTDHDQFDPEANPALKLIRRFLPVTREFHGGHFFHRENKRLFVTPMLLVLVVIETTDLVFAVDSIPAVLAVTRDPFVAYSSNVFAILGLRALYFVLHSVMKMFHYLNYGLCAVLVLIGVKMLLIDLIHFPTWVTLGMVCGFLGLAVTLSLVYPKSDDEALEQSAESGVQDAKEVLL